MTGFVFHDEDGSLCLLKVYEDRYAVCDLSDYEELYNALPIAKTEVVDVDENDVAGLVSLKSLFGISFNTPAYEVMGKIAEGCQGHREMVATMEKMDQND